VDRDSFEQLMNIHGNSIYGFCYSLTMNKDLAEDLYQETMLKAFEVRDRINERENPRSFIISIAIGKWRNLKRKEARRMRITPLAEYDENKEVDLQSKEDPDKGLLHREQRELLDKIFGRMEDKYKIPMILYYKEKYDLETIAKVCNKPKGTIKSRLHKGREIVREELKKEGYFYGG